MPFETIVKKNAFSSTRFYIDKNKIEFDDHSILVKNIAGISYYSVQEKRGIINTGKLFLLLVFERDNEKPYKLLCMYAFGGGSGNEVFDGIFQHVNEYILQPLLLDLHKRLMNKEEVILNKYLTVNRQGAFTRKPGLFKMGGPVFNKWEELEMLWPTEDQVSVHIEDLIIRNISSRQKVGVYHIGWKNSRLFYEYFQWLKANPERMGELNEKH